MKNQVTAYRRAAIAAIAFTALVAAGAAQSRELNWSVGVATQGVQVDLTNGPVWAPQVVMVRPYPVQMPPQYVVVQPPPPRYGPPTYVYRYVTYQPEPVWVRGEGRHGWRRHQRHREVFEDRRDDE